MRVIVVCALLLSGCSQAVEPEMEKVSEVASAVPGVSMEVSGEHWFDQPLTFHLEGPAGNWGIDLTGDGDFEATGNALPAIVNHTYGKVGRFDVTLWTAASTNASAHRMIQIHGPEVTEVSQSMRLIAHSMKGITSYRDCVGLITGEQELDCMVVRAPEHAGMQYALSGRPTPWASFLSSCDIEANEILLDKEGRGEVPAGTGCIVVWGFGADFADLQLRVGPPGSI